MEKILTVQYPDNQKHKDLADAAKNIAVARDIAKQLGSDEEDAVLHGLDSARRIMENDENDFPPEYTGA